MKFYNPGNKSFETDLKVNVILKFIKLSITCSFVEKSGTTTG